MHNVIDISIDFEFGLFNGRAMTVKVTCGDTIVNATPDNPKIKLSKVEIPNQLKLEFSGKAVGKDTRLDASGNIVEDMCVKIVGMRLDHLKIADWVLQKKFTYTTTEGKNITTAYIGFNGTMVIDIPESNIFSLYRRLNKDE